MYYLILTHNYVISLCQEKVYYLKLFIFSACHIRLVSNLSIITPRNYKKGYMFLHFLLYFIVMKS